MKQELDELEAAVRHYWILEFSKTRFPSKLFDAFRMLTHAREEGQSPASIAQLLHAYITHLKQHRK
jgi:hypothetical protein